MRIKKLLAVMIIISLMLAFGGCQKQPVEPQPVTPVENDDDNEGKQEVKTMKMKIGETEVTVNWEENEAVEALRKITAEKELIISMSMYGGFEQVGSLGRSLPRSDTQTVTSAGDIVLYSGNQIVVFYGSNSWSYTRLGHITDKSAEEMRQLLSNGDVTIVIYSE